MSHCFCTVSISTVLQGECHQTVRGCPALHTVRLVTAVPAVPGSTPENIVLPNFRWHLWICDGGPLPSDVMPRCFRHTGRLEHLLREPGLTLILLTFNPSICHPLLQFHASFEVVLFAWCLLVRPAKWTWIVQPSRQSTVRKAQAAEFAKEAAHTACWSNPKGCLWNVCAAGRQHIARTDHTSCICTSNEAALVWEHGKGLSWTACVLLPKHVYFTFYTWLLSRLKVPQVPQSLSSCLWSGTVWIMFPLAIYLCKKAST